MNKKIDILSKFESRYLELCGSFLTAGDPIYAGDFIILAAINRSISNVSAFTLLSKQGNYLAAFTIVRIHLDTLLRLFATTLINDTEKISKAMLDGGNISKLRSKDGDKLTDAFLVKKFVECTRLEWVEYVYRRTSGFIHLSAIHTYSSISGVGEEGAMSFLISAKQSIKKENIEEALDCMIAISELIEIAINERVVINTVD